MSLLLASRLIIVVSLCVSLVIAHGTSCEEQGLYSCKTGEQCFSSQQKCNGHADCTDESDENDCLIAKNATDGDKIHFTSISKGQNLAWLVTPILLLLGAAYGIYKCVKDGVCGAIKRRILHGRRPRENRASDYHPLHQVSFYTSTQIPCTQLGLNAANLTPQQQQQMMLVHNQSFSIHIQGRGMENPITDTSTLPTSITLPPSYDEAMSAMSDGKGGTLIMMKNGNIVAIPQGGLLPPPYPGAKTKTRYCGMSTAASPNQMEAIEELEEAEEDEDEEEDHDDADEETFFIPKESRGEGLGRGGRRRHHSQWSQKRGTSERRRHHSCPS